METGGKTGLNKIYHNIYQPPLPIYAKPDTGVADLLVFPTVHVHTGTKWDKVEHLETSTGKSQTDIGYLLRLIS
jgi:hypothetical protein